MPRKAKPPAIDDDNPEWTKADFAASTKFPEGVRLRDLKPGELARILRKRGPQKEPTKVAVSLRLSRDVVERFKADGPGWQTRMDEALKKAAGL